MNIRISERDLRNLKKRALEEGIPYQTMVSMILHKYLSGRYAERSPQES
jgi:predicted DNA binding CopG/RHH family protein